MSNKAPIGDSAETLENYLGRPPTQAELNLFLSRPPDAPPLSENPRFSGVSIPGYFRGDDISGKPPAAENIVVDEQGNPTYQRRILSSTRTGGTAAVDDPRFTSATDPASVLVTESSSATAAVTTRATQVAVPARKRVKEMDLVNEIEENMLDSPYSYTYHFRLFMMPEDANKAGAVQGYDKQEQIVIAQSGATGIGIDEVSIETVGGITKDAGTGTATKFSFVLKQPFGVSVLDFIEQSARQLDIRNWMKAPFYLELSFKARDNDTQKPIPGPLNDLVWVWPIILTKTSIAVNTGGSVYNMEAVIAGDMSYTNEISDLDQTESITARTVGEFFEELANRLNRRKNDQGEDTTTAKYLDEYKFYIHEDIAKEVIILDGQDSKPNRSGVFDINEDGKTLTFHLNTSVDRIVDSIMSMTKFFQESVTGSDNPDTSDAPAPDEEKVQFTKLWRVLSDSQIRGYDSYRKDYSRLYRYLVIPYEMPTIRNLAKEESTTSPKTIIDVFKRKGTLKKAYNYIFTGLNDQVLDFDVNFNFNWYAALPLNFGLVNSGDAVGLPGTAAVEETNQNPEDVKQTLSSTSRNNAREAEINPDPATGLFNVPNADQLTNIINTTRGGSVAPPVPFNATPEELAEFSRSQRPYEDSTYPKTSGLSGLTTNPVTADDINRLTGRSNQVSSLELRNEAEKVRRREESNRPRRDSGIPSGSFIFAEDIAEFQEKGSLPKIPVSYRKQTHGKENYVNAEGEQNRAKILLSALFEQARSPAAADLLSIELKIKGDPYWLEPAPVGKKKRPISTLERELERRGVPLSSTDGAVQQFSEEAPVNTGDGTVISSASTTTDQTFFVFRLHTPQDFNAETGIMQVPSVNNILNGLYATLHTKHEFSNGQFTQTLQSIRMLDLDLTAELVEDLYRKGKDISRIEESVLPASSSANSDTPAPRGLDNNADQNAFIKNTPKPAINVDSLQTLNDFYITGIGQGNDG